MEGTDHHHHQRDQAVPTMYSVLPEVGWPVRSTLSTKYFVGHLDTAGTRTRPWSSSRHGAEWFSPACRATIQAKVDTLVCCA